MTLKLALADPARRWPVIERAVVATCTVTVELSGSLLVGSKTRTVLFSAQLIAPRMRLPLTVTERAAAVEAWLIGTVKRTEMTWLGSAVL